MSSHSVSFPNRRLRDSAPVALVAIVSALALLAVWWASRAPKNGRTPLVVYCAHDAVYSEEILQEFERQTGIPVQIRFDTEATKSLGLVNLIHQEAAHPRCDVFWNNELLGTVELQQDGLLEPYLGAGWQRMPERYRDPNGYWVGFAARLRIWLFNKAEVPGDEESLQTELQLETSRGAMAVPMFGTTLTHFTVLHHVWGMDPLKKWYRELRRRGLREVPGNALVKDLVASRQCDFGWTDSDDGFVALDNGASVEMLPVHAAGETIAIPNAVAIVKGTQHRREAEQLVDFLTSADTELKLARSRARQIPLGEIDESQLPSEVRQLKSWANEGCDLRGLLDDRRAVLAWLKSEYAP